MADTRFMIGTIEYSLPIPEGFCLPQGEELADSQYIATFDPTNATPVDLQRCGTYNSNYTLVKHARNAPPVGLSRAAFIEVMAQYFADQANKPSLDSSIDKVREGMSEKTDGVMTQGETQFGYTGHDDTCIYLAGKMQVVIDGTAFWRNVGSCTTLVGGRVISIHSYANEDWNIPSAELRDRSRDIAQSIVAR